MTPAIPEPKPSAEALLQAIELIDQASSALDLPVRHTSPEQEAENHRIARRLLDVSSMLRAELSASAIAANGPSAEALLQHALKFSVLLRHPFGLTLSECLELAGILDQLRELSASAPANAPAATPSSRWSEKGEPDPHGSRYDCERAALCGGDMADDELANAVFLDPSIANLTAAKDRIRWLSRKLCAPATTGDAVRKLVEQRDYYRWKLELVMPLFQEARDALCALTVAQIKLHNIRGDLAERMDYAGTANENTYLDELSADKVSGEVGR